jgi:TonB family protein
MLKALFVLLCGVMICGSAAAQTAQPTDTLIYYVKNSGDIVSTKDSADYALFILPNDPADKKSLYPVMGFYLNGKRKLITASRTKSLNLVLEGPRMSFYPDGRRESIITYKNGAISGNITQYYPNGKLYALKQFDENKNQSLYTECRDSTGNILTVNGNGKWLLFNETFTTLLKEGRIKNGNLDGEWLNIIDTAKYARYDKTGERILNAAELQNLNTNENAGRFLAGNIRYPSTDREKKIEGKVTVQFVIEKDGALTHLKTINSPSKTLSNEVLRSIQLSSPWSPIYVKEQTVRALYTLSINFKLSFNGGDIEVEFMNSKGDSAKVFSKVEIQPSFPGGLEAFAKFIDNNLKYPAIDKENGISGRVILGFVVEKDGSLTNFSVERNPSQTMSEEAIRIMKLAPKWSPGMQGGRPVRVNYTIPISFDLEKYK